MKKSLTILGILILLTVVIVSAGCVSEDAVTEASYVEKNFDFVSNGWICETTDTTIRIAFLESGTGLMLMENEGIPKMYEFTWSEGALDNGAKFISMVLDFGSGITETSSMLATSDKNRALFFYNIESIENWTPIPMDRIILDNSYVEDTPVKTQTPTPTPTKTTTTGQDNAVKKAKSYIKYSGYSYLGLIDQLEFEGFTHSEAVYGADNCGADWRTEALEKAKSYIKYSGYSYLGLIDQLEFEEFTHSEAVYGADNCGADWNEEAREKAESYLKYGSFSRQGLYDQLEYEEFTPSQIDYALRMTYDA